MTCHSCRSECKRKGHDRKGNQRYQCRQCSKTFLEPKERPLDGMYLPIAEMVLRLLLEGNSVSNVERLTDVHHTIQTPCSANYSTERPFVPFLDPYPMRLCNVRVKQA